MITIKPRQPKKRLLELADLDYMCDTQLSHFLSILTERKNRLLRSISIAEENLSESDNPVDVDNLNKNRLAKETKILAVVNSSILSIENKTYGYCIKTGG